MNYLDYLPLGIFRNEKKVEQKDGKINDLPYEMIEMIMENMYFDEAQQFGQVNRFHKAVWDNNFHKYEKINPEMKNTTLKQMRDNLLYQARNIKMSKEYVNQLSFELIKNMEEKRQYFLSKSVGSRNLAAREALKASRANDPCTIEYRNKVIKRLEAEEEYYLKKVKKYEDALLITKKARFAVYKCETGNEMFAKAIKLMNKTALSHVYI